MREHRYEIVIRCSDSDLPDGRLFRLSDLANMAGLHPDLIDRFFSLGLIEPATQRPEPLFTDDAVLRICRILRLRRDMGVNLASAGIILDLLDQIEELKRELDRLRR
ncbi:MAG: chaperone modulator CbpM [bacterium]